MQWTANAFNKFCCFCGMLEKGNEVFAIQCNTKAFAFLTDFNEDDYICENDLKRVIQRLCGEQRLSDENINALIQKVIHWSSLATSISILI